MTVAWVRRVAQMTPAIPGQRYAGTSVAESRNRFVLFALAWHANRDGACTISTAELAAITRASDSGVQMSVRSLEASGLIRIHRTNNSANEYTLVREAIEARNPQRMLHERQDIYLLEHPPYHVPSRAIGPLRRSGIQTMTELGALIGDYRDQVETGEPRFHLFVNTNSFGVNAAERIIEGYDQWLASNEGKQ